MSATSSSWPPVLRARIDRRMLVSYRIDPERVQALLPSSFRPHCVGGWGIGSLCLIRLVHVRPRGLPGWCGFASENAAHRFAVEWDDAHGTQQGVYILRRDTNSRLNAWVGGTLFPGQQHRAVFDVDESGDDFRVAVRSLDGTTRMLVEGTAADELPEDSVFGNPEAASTFFRNGSRGFSAGSRPGAVEGMELCCRDWSARPLTVRAAESSCFDDERLFPPGTIELDSALLMQGIDHEWRSCGVENREIPIGRSSTSS